MNRPHANNTELEGVRGIACLLVGLGHTLYLTHLDPSVTLPATVRTFEAAHAGVLIFFMLSGYLIAWTNPGPCSSQNRRRYLGRRLLRLTPIYYVALLLTGAVIFFRHDQGQGRNLVATFAGVQNFNDYFGVHLPPPSINGPLWSLNYELIYYGLFILLWRFQPALSWVFLPALVATILGWFAPHIMPLFAASYACGWLFWATGWWLARQPEVPVHESAAPVATWLCLIFSGHHIGGFTRILNVLGLHSNDAGMVTLGDLGLIPAVLLLLASAGRRRLPGKTVLVASAWTIALVPVAGMLWTGRLWTNPAWISGSAAIVVAVILLPWKSIHWLSSFAGLGRISYAFYVIHFPLLFFVQRLPVPRGTIPSYALRIGIWAFLSIVLAWLLEQRFQPWIRSQLRAPVPS